MNKYFSVLAIAVMYVVVGSALAQELDRPLVYKSWTSEKHYITKIEISDEEGNTVSLKNWRDPRFLKVLREGNYKEVWVR